jgi:uncharacterized protein (UPF0335 family)
MTDTVKDGGNLTALKKHIKDGVDKIEKFKEQRSNLNDKISEVRTALAAEGIPKKALDMALSYMNMEPDKREGFDLAYTIVREAIGLKMEPDLFDQVGGAEPVIGKSKKKEPDAAGIAAHMEKGTIQ